MRLWGWLLVGGPRSSFRGGFSVILEALSALVPQVAPWVLVSKEGGTSDLHFTRGELVLSDGQL